MAVTLKGDFGRSVADDLRYYRYRHSAFYELGHKVMPQCVGIEKRNPSLLGEFLAQPGEFIPGPLFVKDIRPALPTGFIEGDVPLLSALADYSYVLGIRAYTAGAKIAELLRSNAGKCQKSNNGLLLWLGYFEDLAKFNRGYYPLLRRLFSQIFYLLGNVRQAVIVFKIFVKTAKDGQNDVS